MSDLYRDPAKEPAKDAKFKSALQDPGDWAEENPVGPGGKTTNIENDERGILTQGLFKVIAKHKYADLGSDHDSHKQGVYRTNSVGDRD